MENFIVVHHKSGRAIYIRKDQVVMVVDHEDWSRIWCESDEMGALDVTETVNDIMRMLNEGGETK